jgi:hypothetical protein
MRSSFEIVLLKGNLDENYSINAHKTIKSNIFHFSIDEQNNRVWRQNKDYKKLYPTETILKEWLSYFIDELTKENLISM